MNASRWPQRVAIGVNRDGQSAAPPSGESLNGVPTLTSRSAPSHYESQQAQPLDQQSIGLMVEEAVIEARNISKHYGATIALDNATLRVFPGEIVGLVGENGAGKSTLVRIIGGAERPDNGEIRLAGAHCEWRDAADALRHGVAVVHQEPQIYPKLSVLENLMLATLPSKWLLAVDRTRLRAEGRNLLGMFALSEDLLDVRMGELSTATQELLVIARRASLPAGRTTHHGGSYRASTLLVRPGRVRWRGIRHGGEPPGARRGRRNCRQFVLAPPSSRVFWGR